MITSQIELVTPQLADKYLQTSKGNRKISDSYVEMYAKAMREGRWMLNGVSIVFDDSGALIDGHHRLKAVVKSGTSVRMSIVRGVDSSAFATYDCGRTRTFKQVLELNGVKDNINVASIVLASESWRKYGCLRETNGKGAKMSNDDAMRVYESDKEEFYRITRIANALYHKTRMLSVAMIGGMYYNLIHVLGYNEECVSSFFTQLNSYSESDSVPIEAMRRMLLKAGQSHMKIDRHILVAILIKTWNAYITNTKTRKITYDPTKDEYPTLQPATKLF